MGSISLEGSDIQTKREELLAYFHQSFDLFESLFDLLDSDEVFFRQSEPTRHPMIFYFGHTAVFYINKLLLANVLKERINPRFESLFAVGVDEMLWDEESGRFEWPSVQSVREYRKEVRACVDQLVRAYPMTLPITQESPFWAVWMGIEHERIHIETSSVLHRQMPLKYVRSLDAFPRCPVVGEAPENTLVEIAAENITLGKGDADHGLYGWDNEYGTRRCEVAAFEASLYLVSNAEYLEFVRDGGYQTQKWWDQEGLKYLSLRQAESPPFWIPKGEGVFRYRALAEEMEMPLNWPVEVNALEAQAFCRWKSAREGRFYRLPNEAEWAVMAQASQVVSRGIFDDVRANLNFAHYASSVPVNTYKQGPLYDVVGNVWQWTQTPIDGFDGFAPHPWYDDFSLPTFDGKHNLIKGGSWISTGNEIVMSSRYAFRRHFIQHAGFRYVVGDAADSQFQTTLITDPEAVASCRFHYEEGVGIFKELMGIIRGYFSSEDSVLELGCGAGRLSLELSSVCAKVTGIDFSARYIAVGTKLLEQGRIDYGTPPKQIELDALNLPDAKEKVAFYQGDIYNLKPNLRGYDVILVNNIHNGLVLDRIPMADLSGRLKEGGYFILLGPKTEQWDIDIDQWGIIAAVDAGDLSVKVWRKNDE